MEIEKFSQILQRLKEKGKVVVVSRHLEIPHHGEPLVLVENPEVFENIVEKSNVIAAMVAYDERANMLVIYGRTRLDWLYVLYDRHVHVSTSTFRLSGPSQVRMEVQKAISEFYKKWEML